MTQKTQPRIVGADIPITEYHKEMIVAHTSLLKMFLQDVAEKAQDKELEPGAISGEVGTYTSDEFYRMFVSYAAAEKQSTNEITKSNFGVKISHEKVKSLEKKCKKIKGKSYNMYIFDLDAFVAEMDLPSFDTGDGLTDDDAAVVEAAAAIAAEV